MKASLAMHTLISPHQVRSRELTDTYNGFIFGLRFWVQGPTRIYHFPDFFPIATVQDEKDGQRFLDFTCQIID